jgi:threonylcarbamoyladenosine tRNA methylthiotransferase MtaB
MTGVEVVTFGCRLNAFESEAIGRAAAAAGLDGAVILNTCAVTAEAERQARQAIRRARREHPQARIIVTGCAATLAPERYAAMPEVDRVLDNAAKLRAESYREPPGVSLPLPPIGGEGRARGADQPRIPPSPRPSPANWGERESTAGTSAEPRARAYLQVQQGCDHRCTFCIIPYARGPSRSVPPEPIVAEARRLLAAGVGEIVLTGVDLTAYGADLPGAPSLGGMVRHLLAELPGLRRLRLSSLDPAEIDDELWRVLAAEPRLMPHLHLSLQSGDDLVLKRMRRRHSRAQAIAAARRARALRPGVALGADLIAGFPTESEDMFRRSLDLVEECGLAFVHVFPYSPRPGTPAARMPAVPPAVVRERAARLRAAAAAALAADLDRRVGSDGEVLIERPGQGRAECYAAVDIAGVAEPGSVRRMRFLAHDGRTLLAVPF